ADGSYDSTGNYSLSLQRLSAAQRCGPGSLACDIVATATIDANTDTDLYNFSGVANEIVQIVLGDNGGPISLPPDSTLIPPDGSLSPVCGASSAATGRDCTLPVAGLYALEAADGSYDSTGTYSLSLQRLTAAQRCGPGALNCDAVLTATIDANIDTDLY